MSGTTQASGKIGAIAGVAFAVLLFLSVAMFNSLRAVTDQELMEGWTDGGFRRDSLVSMYLMLLAAPCFLVFVSQLRARLRAVAPENSLVDLMYGAGIVFVSALSMTAFSRALIAQTIRFWDEPLPGPDTLRYATSFSQSAFAVVAIPFATMVVATASIMILMSGVMSRWLGWLGLAVTVLSLVAIVLLMGPLATPLILVWVLGASALLFRSRGTPATAVEMVPGVAQAQPPGLMSHP